MRTYKDDIQDILLKSPRTFGNVQHILKNKYPEIYNNVINSNGDNFSEKLYNFEYNNSCLPLCKVCNGTNNRFISFANGYNDTCCKNPCGLKYNEESIKAGHIKAKQTNIEKYGGPAPIYSKDVQHKIKQTNIEKYGVEHPLQNDNVQNKIKQTNIEKYGVDHFMKTKSGVEKVQLTNMERYGGVSPMSDDIVKDKVRLKRLEHIDEITNKIAYTRKKNFINNIENKYNVTLIDSDLYIGIRNHSIKQTDYARYKYNCNVCKLIFDAMAQSPLCPNCCPKVRSILENDLYLILAGLLPNITIYRNKYGILKHNRTLDFYFEFGDKKYAIEFNGLYYHSETCGKDKHYHITKTIECENANIQLIHIFEDEFLEKRDIIENKLKHIFKLSSNKPIYARNCEIHEISVADAREFLNKNHIQGYTNSTIKYGAFNNDILVGVMTFNNGRYALGSRSTLSSEYELVRFSTNTSVIGLGSKMLSYFIQQYSPTKILSYADKRWSSKLSNIYEKIGFKYIGETVPNYWYTKGQKRLHRINFAKHMLKDKLSIFDNNKTEYENMLDNGYHRVWDCGHLKYEMILS